MIGFCKFKCYKKGCLTMFEFIGNTISSTLRYCIGRAVYDTFVKDKVDGMKYKKTMQSVRTKPPTKSYVK